MLTVKYCSKEYEMIKEAKSVFLIPCKDPTKHECGGFVISRFMEDGDCEDIHFVGKVYVMNNEGSTIAIYDMEPSAMVETGG